MSGFRPASSLYRETKAPARASDGYSEHSLCPYNEDGVCSISRAAVEQGFRKSLISCSTTIPRTCEIYLKTQRGQTLEDIYGGTRK